MVNNLDNFLSIANKVKLEKGLNDEYCAMLPMIQEKDNKLYVIVPFIKSDAKVWSKENQVVPEYWCMIDLINMGSVEFNKTCDKNFNDNELIPNTSNDSFNKEVSKYVVKAKMRYKEYIQNDIKSNDLLTYQKDVSRLVDNINMNDEKISLNDYFYANFEDDINEQIDKLVDLIALTKYNSLTTYYDLLFTNIINEYLDKNVINQEKIQVACNMMNTYYPGVNGINNIFNK